MAKPVFESIDKNMMSIKTLIHVRDTLLPKLISCELRIPEAEELMTEALQ